MTHINKSINLKLVGRINFVNSTYREGDIPTLELVELLSKLSRIKIQKKRLLQSVIQ